MLHILKIKPEYWEAICRGSKRFEVRQENDRYFSVGDKVQFDVLGAGPDDKKWNICYVLRDFEGLIQGWVVFGIE